MKGVAPNDGQGRAAVPTRAGLFHLILSAELRVVESMSWQTNCGWVCCSWHVAFVNVVLKNSE